MNDLVRFYNGVQLATNQKKRGRKPIFNARQFYPYKEELRLKQALKKEIERFINEAYNIATRGVSFSDDIQDLTKLNPEPPEDFLKEVQAVGRSINQNVANAIVKSSEMIIGKPYYPPEVKQSIFTNWAANFQMLCVSAETDAKKEISRIVAQATNEGWNGKQLEKEIKGHVLPQFQNRAELIARTETAKLNSETTRATYKEIGIKYYMWLSTADDRTRTSHLAMDGKICDVDNPNIYYEETPEGLIEKTRGGTMVHLHPGEDFQCRCTMVEWDPAIDGQYEIKENKEAEEREKEEAEKAKEEEAKEKAKEEELAKVTERAEKAEKRATEAERRAEILRHANERHAKRSEKDRECIINTKVWNDKLKEIKKQKNIAYNEIKKLPRAYTEKEIIERIAGGDRTKGSCASLAFAYVANKAGFDVLDFRGGKSCDYFALRENRLILFKNYLKEFSHKNGFTAAKTALNTLEEGKEYYFFTGKHAAIVRKRNDIIEYLELQDRILENNGFKQFEMSDRFLKKRFACQKSLSSFGFKFEQEAYLVDIDKITNNRKFKQMMGYINTFPDKQMKGILGGIK